MTFNFYNEPTLDIHFEERIAFLQGSGLKLIIHTNGSGLTKDRLMLLKESDLLEAIKFNFPVTDEKTFVKITGYHGYKKVVENIYTALNMGIPVSFVVNGKEIESKRNGLEIQRLFQIDPSQIDLGKRLGERVLFKGGKKKTFISRVYCQAAQML
ncbi:MAG: radical SAM protein [Clostridia bacterium]